MRKLILLIACLVAFSTQAQFENKLNAVVFVGLPFYPKSEITNPMKNVFSDYQSIPMVGVGLDYAFNNHLSIGPNFRFLFVQNDDFSAPVSTLGLEMKYNILPSDKKYSPFFAAEFNLTSMNVTQGALHEDYDLNSSDIEGSVEVRGQGVHSDEATFAIEMVPGYMLGGGLDLVIKQKYGMYFSVNYMSTQAHKDPEVLELYSDNQSRFHFVVIRVGVKFGFLRKKSLI